MARTPVAPAAEADALVAAIAANYDEELIASTLGRLHRLQAVTVCDHCKESKPLQAFSVQSREPDGLRRTCRKCIAAARRRGPRKDPHG
jgi:hypothetical protein